MDCNSWGDIAQHLCKTLKDKGVENPPSRDSPSRAAGLPLCRIEESSQRHRGA